MNDHSYSGMPKEHLTKQEIRSAARRLFAARGYAAVAVKEIADAIGKRPGGLYNHFASKHAILVDLMEDNLVRALDSVFSCVEPTAPPAQQLEQFARAHVAFNIANRDDVFIAYMELRSLNDEGARTILPRRDQFEQALRSILELGVAQGVFIIPDISHHARAILSMLVGVTVWYRPDGAKSSAEIAEFYVQAVLQSVGFVPAKRELN